MVEKEAIKHRCPMNVEPNCQASNCMAWRWKGIPFSWLDGTFAINSDAPKGSAEGYCGLAGKPETAV